MPVLRVHLKHKDREYASIDDYTFDIVVDAKNKPLKKVPFFGLWGEFSKPDNRYPVVLLSDGQIDLGAAREEDDRFHKTNMHEKIIKVGELVTVWEPSSNGPSDEYTLEISLVKNLLELNNTYEPMN
ncbi:MAG: hypothetical protein WC612_03540 [Bdellovibrionales bacterium]|jgi:hypothetical protein